MALNNTRYINDAAVTQKNTDRPGSGEEPEACQFHSRAFTAIMGCVVDV